MILVATETETEVWLFVFFVFFLHLLVGDKIYVVRNVCVTKAGVA